MGFKLRQLLCVTGVILAAGPAFARDYIVMPGRIGTQDAQLVMAQWQEQGLSPQQLSVAEVAQLAPSADGRVLYYSGPVGRGAQGLTLTSPQGPVPAAQLLSGEKTLLIVNNCGTNMNLAASDFDLRGVWIAAFPASGGCDAAQVAENALTALTGDVADWPVRLRAAGLRVTLPRTQGATLPPQTVVNDTIVISTLRPSLTAGPRIIAQDGGAPQPSGATAPLPVPGPPLIGDEGSRMVQPRRPDLPEPSIIVGEAAAQPQPQIPRGPLGVSYDERARLRQDDPQAYAQLIKAGQFDPDPAQLALAIQTELGRMSCYSGTLDGVWGRGSVTGAERYFRAASLPVPGALADVTLYRAILAGPDLTCPAPPSPSAAPASRSQAAPGNSGRPRSGTTVRRGTAPQPTARNPARGTQPTTRNPRTPTQPRIDPNFGGSGVFR